MFISRYEQICRCPSSSNITQITFVKGRPKIYLLWDDDDDDDDGGGGGGDGDDGGGGDVGGSGGGVQNNFFCAVYKRAISSGSFIFTSIFRVIRDLLNRWWRERCFFSTFFLTIYQVNVL